ncbi:hypothetical protein Q765_18665 [Flavobacterium rivuli WB 3.3-2 = DSM 21788]|uniref:Oxygen sensor histidine kinase NreB n=1 Tax=Flavobacterium rivuli WB 3.3-2 = DSM 21788 TaxID=1121895 RepID=A0A0A2M9R4_9FLAO|nr:sensor histidine kinase [Flavobacterium rivuli]KGO85035.1 hypothetical protein Q765_18665 [Flavobacterium rivuli WB 3.3-2 = DSM 21788]
MKILLRIALFTCLLYVSKGYSQYNQKLLLAEKNIKDFETNKASTLLKSIDTAKLSLPNKALYTYINAGIFEQTEQNTALSYYIQAKKLFIKADSLEKAMDINLDIAYMIDSQEKNTTEYWHYINEYLSYWVKTKNASKIARGYGYVAVFKQRAGKYDQSLMYYKKALALFTDGHDDKMKSSLINNLANLYFENLKMPDSALFYLKKNAEAIKINGNDPDDLYYNYLNQAGAYHHLKNYAKALKLLHKLDSLPLKSDPLKYKEAAYGAMHVNYAELNNFKEAYKYLRLEQKLADSINVTEQNVAINDIQTKYQTKEKEWENSVLKNNMKFNNIVLYIIIGLFIASLVIGILIVMNSRRKEKIALQQKLIDEQRFEKALKDYELSSIDIMLTGQEKERQRIANDLHDNLGSMLATLKLNFENLRLRKTDQGQEENKLYEKTDELIQEAYQKVRRLAHAKNAGVFANDGLIPAIKKLAGKISIPGKLQINVIPFGFTERLDNTLEIAIFRMIQELGTNIIKHSGATEATLHLTQHDTNINIIFEDNGVGMDTSKLTRADGMGLNSITKKTEQLDGTLTIDSTPGRGTTIIIDLPI